MSCSVDVILDSIGPNGIRLTTLSLKYPRIVHCEYMTHREFSRNASSSRAIPWSRMRQWILDDPYIPIHWGQNIKGMQATAELPELVRYAARREWLSARDAAVEHADTMSELGVHKQIINRLVENFGHINVVMSTTSIGNFVKLRVSKAAMPEIQQLAVMIGRAMIASEPQRLEAGEWHLPYVTPAERPWIGTVKDKIGLSVARCGRVSYKTLDGADPSRPHDLERHQELITSDPMHATPTEHQAMATGDPNLRSGNFRGWVQYRKTLPNEVAGPHFDWQARVVEWDGVEYIV